MKYKISVLCICLLRFISSPVAGQVKSGPYLGYNTLNEFFSGYEFKLRNRLAVGLQANLVVGILPVNLYSESGYPPAYLFIRPLSQNGIRLRTMLNFYSANMRLAYCIQPEVCYLSSYKYREEDYPGQSGSPVKEFHEKHRIGGLVLTITQKLGYRGHIALLYSAGVRYKVIKREYTGVGNRDNLDPSNKVEYFQRFEPVINLGITYYFKALD